MKTALLAPLSRPSFPSAIVQILTRLPSGVRTHDGHLGVSNTNCLTTKVKHAPTWDVAANIITDQFILTMHRYYVAEVGRLLRGR